MLTVFILNLSSFGCTGGGANSEGTGDPTGNPTGDPTGNPTGETPPAAAVLQLSFSQIKQFDFKWSSAGDAAYYQLHERKATDVDYQQLGDNIVGDSISLTMPLHLRFGASYVLSACNDAGCTDSAPVDVVNSMAVAVGYFKASNTHHREGFGAAVALSADGNTLAVGAPVKPWGVYVFIREDSSWIQQAYLENSATDVGDNNFGAGFGDSIALSADGDTLAVGAPSDLSLATGIGGDQTDISGVEVGAAYLFTRSDDTWSQPVYLKASNSASFSSFGRSVGLSGDGDTLAVGAPLEGGDSAEGADDSAEGAVYMFVRSNSAWSEHAYLKASNAGGGDAFGNSVAVSGDGATLAVGAYSEGSAATGIDGDQTDNSAPGAGAVYVFARMNATWSQVAYVKPSTQSDSFGFSIAISGDGNTLGVGAPDAGHVYVFARADGAWSQAYVSPGRGEIGFGVALSADGRTLASGVTVDPSEAVGVGDDPTKGPFNASRSGAVFVSVRSNDGWSEEIYVKASNTAKVKFGSLPVEWDWFGWSVALSGDGSTLAVGAPFEDSGALGIGGNQSQVSSIAYDSGAVYLY